MWLSKDDPTQQGWPNHPQLQSGTINLLQVLPYYWCTTNQTMELKISIQFLNDIQCWFMMSHLISKMNQTPKTPVRNHQCPQSMNVLLMNFFPCYGAKNQDTTHEWHIMLIHGVKFDIKYGQIPQNSNQETSISSKYECVLHVLLIMLGSWKSAYNSRMT